MKVAYRTVEVETPKGICWGVQVRQYGHVDRLLPERYATKDEAKAAVRKLRSGKA